jgi:hypothetical protein
MAKSLSREQEIPARVAPAFGVTAVFPISLTANLDTVVISLTGGMAVTTGGGALIGDGILNLITSVDLVGNGSIPLVSVPFSTLVNANIWRRADGFAPVVSQPALGVAVNAYSAIGILDLASYLALRPKDSTLVEQSFSTLELRLNIAADFTGVQGGGGSVTATGTSTIAVNVIAKETIELPDQSNKVSMPNKRIQTSARDNPIAGAGTRNYMRLTPGQFLRGLAFRVQTAAGANSDAILTAVRVYVGNSLRYQVSGAGIIAENTANMRAARTAGYYFINFTKQTGSVERLADELDLLIATLSGADAYLEMDVNAATTIKVAQFGHVPL